MVEITIVRHGRTTGNESGRIQGQSNTPLAPLGLLQAEALARRFAEVRFDRVYSSDLERAMETAKIITGNTVPVQPAPELREMDLGNWVGKSAQDLRQNCPEEYAGIFTCDPKCTISGGESIAQLMERTGRFLDRIAAERDGESVLLISHGLAIRTMFMHILGIPGPMPRTPQVDNVSVSSAVCREGIWQLVRWNDVSHLKDLTATPDRY